MDPANHRRLADLRADQFSLPPWRGQRLPRFATALLRALGRRGGRPHRAQAANADDAGRPAHRIGDHGPHRLLRAPQALAPFRFYVHHRDRLGVQQPGAPIRGAESRANLF